MKNSLRMFTAFFLILVLPGIVQAGSFGAYETEVEQGGVLVFNIAPEWRAPAFPNPAISIFGEHYSPNKKGDVFVGVGIDKLGKYNARLVEYGRGVPLTSDTVEIEVVRAVFNKTRTAAYTGPPSARKGAEVNAINKAFDLFGKIGDFDQAFTEPLDNHRGVIDSFGLIYRNNKYKAHRGVDYRIPVRTPVRSINDATVAMVANRFSKEGNMVILYHGHGIFSVYMHLARIDVKKNQIVRRGDIIGLSGATGAGIREPHLHFSVRINKTYVDPISFIETINHYLK